MDPIIRGSAWTATIEVIRDPAWAEDYGAGITPNLILSRSRKGGTPDLAVATSAVSIVGDSLTATVSIAALETASLPLAASYYAALQVGDEVFPISEPAVVLVNDAPGQG